MIAVRLPAGAKRGQTHAVASALEHLADRDPSFNGASFAVSIGDAEYVEIDCDDGIRTAVISHCVHDAIDASRRRAPSQPEAERVAKVTAVRLPPDLLETIREVADEHETTAHAVIVAAARIGVTSAKIGKALSDTRGKQKKARAEVPRK